MKALVVFYSLTGITRQIAREIAGLLDCDTEEIIDLKSRSGILGFLSGSKDALTRELTGIKQTSYDPANYDMVIIGTPVWAFTMAPAIRTYMNAYRERFRQVAFFCTLGGAGGQKTLRDMQDLCAKNSRANLWITIKEMKRASYFQEVKDFCDKLRT